MKNLTNEELKNINGGAINVGLWLGIAAGITFFVGFIDGLVRPYKCR